MNDMTNTPVLVRPSAAPGEPIAALPPLVAYWFALKRHKWVMTAIPAACIIVAIVATLLATPRYQAIARIEIARQAEQVTEYKAVEAIDTGKDQEFYQTQYALLKARFVAERVARSLNLASDDRFFAMFGRDPNTRERGPAQRRERLRQAAAILLDNVEIAPVRGSSLVDIEFSSPDPELSARVANAWADQFIAATLDRRFASTQDARDFLEKRLAEIRGRVENSERDLVDYAGARGIISLGQAVDANGRTTPERTVTAADLDALNGALGRATDARIQAQSALAAGLGPRLLANNPALAGLRQQRAEVAAELARLSANFEPAYPEVKAAQAKLASLDRALGAEERRMNAGLRNEYREAAAREAALKARVTALKRSLIGEQAASIQLKIHQRDVDTNRQLYEGLLQRFKEIGVAGVASNNVAVVDRAQVPRTAASPNLILNLLLGCLLGMLLAVVLVIALEQADQKIKDPADVRQRLGLPLLGVIPAVEQSRMLLDLADPKSDIAEAYLSVQTNLSFLTDHGVPRSILFTSTQPNEGKSSSVSALGRTLARTGKRVLVIDADMRNSSIHAMFGLPSEPGLSNYLAGEDFGARLLRDSGVPGLTLMTAGPVPPSAGELLMSPRLADLIASAAARFDVILIDAPPVLGIADVPLIAKAVEGVVYAIESGGARLRPIQQSLERLRAAQAHVFGAVITKNDSRTSEYGYGYGHAYGYGRREEKEAA